MRAIFALLLMACPGLAQEAYEVELDCPTPYALMGSPVEVSYRITMKEDGTVPAALLSGGGMTLSQGGRACGVLVAPKQEGVEVELSKGVSVAGKVSFKVSALLKQAGLGGESGKMVELELGLGPKAKAKVTAVPDFKDVPLEKLDLAKTKVLLVTDFGTIKLGFRPDKAPRTVANFIDLAKRRYYDMTRFHRVIKGFMLQGGNYETRAEDAPSDEGKANNVDAEFSDLKHVKGVISMARLGNDINSANSQFFIMHAANNFLDGQYSAFGKVEEGLDVVDKICEQPVTMSPQGELSKPGKPIWLRQAIVLGVLEEGR